MNNHNQRLYRAARKRRKYVLKLAETMTHEAIGRQLGITKQRVGQIIKRAKENGQEASRDN